MNSIIQITQWRSPRRFKSCLCRFPFSLTQREFPCRQLYVGVSSSPGRIGDTFGIKCD